MSTIQTNSITDAAGTGAPDFPNGIEVSAGNVGIGGTATLPAVTGGITTAAQLSVQSASGGYVGVFRNDTTTVTGNSLGGLVAYGNDTTSNTPVALAYALAIADGTHDPGDNPTALAFGTTPDGSATVAERMRITSTGNVGIGNTSPDVKLAVNDSTQDLQVRIGSITAGIDPIVRMQGKNVANTTNRFIDLKLNADTALFTITAPDTVTPTINAIIVNASGGVLMPEVYEDTVTGRDLFIASDGRLGYVSSTRASKTNIQDLSDVSWLYDLNPVSFQYRVRNEDDTYSDEIQPQPEYGLIAEDVELVNPDLVFYDETENGRELRGIQYSRLIAPLLKAIQEQQSLITDLTARVAQLEAR